MSDRAWRIFKGNQAPHNGIQRLLKVKEPKWRGFSGSLSSSQRTETDDTGYWKELRALASEKKRDIERGETFRLQSHAAPANELDGSSAVRTNYDELLDAVNAALYLRRPLLITGRPGSGKTSLAYAVAFELQLGPVLLWPITARSTLQEGLYQYDAIARLQDAQLSQNNPEAQQQASRNIGQYITLGPVGTAFYPSATPRVLLIDEIDKSDINLPNELLNLFEEGAFKIAELERLSRQGEEAQPVKSADDIDITIEKGRVQCGAFPLIIMTSNGERDFPPAFYRRCLRVQMPDPSQAELTEIVKAHLGSDTKDVEALIAEFWKESEQKEKGLATDQLLNTVYLLRQGADEAALKKLLLKSMTEVDSSR